MLKANSDRTHIESMLGNGNERMIDKEKLVIILKRDSGIKFKRN